MMSTFNRRDFLRGGAAAAAWAAAGGSASRLLWASPLGLPIGLELYTVRQQYLKDPKGTLQQVAAIGYQEVELFTMANQKPADLKAMVEAAGLKAPSGHTSAESLAGDVDALAASFREAGLDYMICAFPGHKPGTAQPMVRIAGRPHEPMFTQDDYKWMAETFNKAGEKCKQAGLQLGYHCHNLDFVTFDGEPALDYLLGNTDPKLVQLEMDCYWVTRAGKDPVAYLKKYAGRVPILHIKDMKPGLKPTTSITEGGDDDFTEVGKGVIDWKRIFAAAPEGGVKHYFVEQDHCDRPPMESAKISYEYLKNLQVG
jgi:sugar phosphate isomerase/epimerase